MKVLFCALLASLILVPLTGAFPQQQAPVDRPGWAFPVADKVQPPRGDPNTPVKVAGSSKSYTEKEVDDLTSPRIGFPRNIRLCRPSSRRVRAMCARVTPAI